MATGDLLLHESVIGTVFEIVQVGGMGTRIAVGVYAERGWI